jgi:hypothetical protein
MVCVCLRSGNLIDIRPARPASSAAPTVGTLDGGPTRHGRDRGRHGRLLALLQHDLAGVEFDQHRAVCFKFFDGDR